MPFNDIVAPLTWPEWIARYRRLIGIPYSATISMRRLPSCSSPRNGGLQGNYLKHIAALFPDRRRVLHLFAGKVDLAAFPGDTLDIRPELEPTWCCNAETCDGVPL